MHPAVGLPYVCILPVIRDARIRLSADRIHVCYNYSLPVQFERHAFSPNERKDPETYLRVLDFGVSTDHMSQLWSPDRLGASELSSTVSLSDMSERTTSSRLLRSRREHHVGRCHWVGVVCLGGPWRRIVLAGAAHVAAHPGCGTNHHSSSLSARCRTDRRVSWHSLRQVRGIAWTERRCRRTRFERPKPLMTCKTYVLSGS